MPRAIVLLISLPLLATAAAMAAPRVPASDAEVLERVSARATDVQARERAALRRQALAAPADPVAAADLARALMAQALAEGDPRPVGQAQAALARWWTDPSPPPVVRVQRAVIRQYGHHFAAALADLDAATQARPGDAEAWAWTAALHMVRADYGRAAQACQVFATLDTPLVGVACSAYADSMRGRAGAAVAALRAALQADARAGTPEPAQRVWALTRLAEIEHRLGQEAAAESTFRAALALAPRDVYLLAAWADFLLDQRRPAEVLRALDSQGRADVLLLRLAIAAKAGADATFAKHRSELTARFDAARARGDTTHRKEEARFLLEVVGDLPRALTLARANWAEQREASDARTLLEAALAAKDAAAAQPVLQWMAEHGVEGARLAELASQLKAPR